MRHCGISRRNYPLQRFVRRFGGSTPAAANRSLLAQGVGTYGNLGLGEDLHDSPNCYIAIDVLSGGSSPLSVRSVAAGWGHSAVVTVDGKLLIFGRPYDFSTLLQIDRIRRFSSVIARFVSSSSNSALFGASTSHPSAFFPLPVLVSLGEEAAVQQVSCSAGLTVAVTDTGNVHSFGLNRWLQCGVPVPDETKNEIHLYQPQRVPLKERCVAVDTGLQHCLALTDKGEVLAWGKCSKGQLGVGEQLPDEQCSLPVRVLLQRGNGSPQRATAIAAGFAHSAALVDDGTVFVWGKGMSAQIKDKDTETSGLSGIDIAYDQFTPRHLALPGGRRVIAICCSNAQVVMLADDNSAWVIGMGEYDRNAVTQPLQVQTDYDDTSEEHIALSTESTVPKDTFLVVPPGARLIKGHDRVRLIMPHKGLDSHFDIILHEGEAYVKPMTLQLCDDAIRDDVRIIDLSCGWRHNLLLVEH